MPATSQQVPTHRSVLSTSLDVSRSTLLSSLPSLRCPEKGFTGDGVAEDNFEGDVAAAEQMQREVSRLAISSIDMDSVQDPFDEALQVRTTQQYSTQV